MEGAELRFGSTVLFVDDVRAVLDFYKAALGFETRFYDEEFDFGELETGSVGLAIASHRSGALMMPGHYERTPVGNPQSVELAFYTADVAASYEKAISAGALSLAAPKKMAWGQTVAYVRSIEGTIIGLCTPLP